MPPRENTIDVHRPMTHDIVVNTFTPAAPYAGWSETVRCHSCDREIVGSHSEFPRHKWNQIKREFFEWHPPSQQVKTRHNGPSWGQTEMFSG